MTTNPRWRAEYTYDNGTAHVTPLGDAIDHLDDDCVCGPVTEPVERADGSIGWIVTHNSLDGRELTEPHAEEAC